MSTAMTVPKVEDLTLSITDEIHVKATPEVTFEALLEELSSGMTGSFFRRADRGRGAW